MTTHRHPEQSTPICRWCDAPALGDLSATPCSAGLCDRHAYPDDRPAGWPTAAGLAYLEGTR